MEALLGCLLLELLLCAPGAEVASSLSDTLYPPRTPGGSGLLLAGDQGWPSWPCHQPLLVQPQPAERSPMRTPSLPPLLLPGAELELHPQIHSLPHPLASAWALGRGQ